MRSLSLRIAAAGAALLAVGAAQAQTIGGFVDLGVRNILASEENVSSDKSWAQSAQPIDYSKTVGIYHGPQATDQYLYAGASASVDGGFGRIKALARSVTTDQWGDALTVMSLSQEDRFTIDSPGLTGTIGTFDAKIRVDGTYAIKRSGSGTGLISDWTVDYGLTYDDGGATEGDAGAGGLNLRGSREWSPLFNGTTGATFGTYTVPVTFVYGTPLALSLDFGLSTRAYGGGGDILSDFTHTVEWAGIANLRDANGQSVNAFTASSLSGYDYGRTAPVPEPASIAALAVGATTLLRRRRRA